MARSAALRCGAGGDDRGELGRTDGTAWPFNPSRGDALSAHRQGRDRGTCFLPINIPARPYSEMKVRGFGALVVDARDGVAAGHGCSRSFPAKAVAGDVAGRGHDRGVGDRCMSTVRTSRS